MYFATICIGIQYTHHPCNVANKMICCCCQRTISCGLEAVRCSRGLLCGHEVAPRCYRLSHDTTVHKSYEDNVVCIFGYETVGLIVHPSPHKTIEGSFSFSHGCISDFISRTIFYRFDI